MQLSPIDMTVTSTPTFTWSSVAGATQYWLAVSDSSKNGVINQPFNLRVLNNCPGGTCSLASPLPLAPGTVSWAIVGMLDDGTAVGTWSPNRTFTVASSTATRPPLPAVMHAYWDMVDANQGASLYRLQVDAGQVFDVPIASSCDREMPRVCRWDISLNDYGVHQVAVWAVRGAEEGPKATLQVSLVDQAGPGTPASPLNIRFGRD